ncbi:MAG: 16S rRNA (uracil(1498)-N(3))-methyltransferase [Firmicutes bacterium]|nr:16S rRNA (uracil(1498)-N(3))-methyltransferase [Bacillota bacterium]
MPRFWVKPDDIRGDTVTVNGAEARHMIRVLRLGPGDIITILDGCGSQYRCRIVEKAGECVYCRVLERAGAGGEPPRRVVLLQGLAKGDKMDTVIQKGTELGASIFVPVFCRRSVVRLDAAKGVARRRRWQRIAAEAAKQCRRALVPEVTVPLGWSEALELIPPGAFTLLPWEEVAGRPLKRVLQCRAQPPAEVYIIIGPEGGLEPEEVEEARSRGAVPVSLGPRILRTETAGPAVITMVLYQWGDLGESSNG